MPSSQRVFTVGSGGAWTRGSEVSFTAIFREFGGGLRIRGFDGESERYRGSAGVGQRLLEVAGFSGSGPVGSGSAGVAWFCCSSGMLVLV